MPKPNSAATKEKGAAAKHAKAAAKGTDRKQRKQQKRREQQQLSAAELMQRAQLALAVDDYDGAKDALRRAVAAQPSNTDALDALGALLAEVGPPEEAIQVLQRSAALAPESGHEKFLYLGQLLEGEEAVAATSTGVELLQRAVGAEGEEGGDEGTQLLRAQLCGALCALAELRLSLAGGEGPSEEVEALLTRAQAADPSSPEPLQALASLRYEQGQPDEALQLLRQSMLLWFAPCGDEDADSEGRGSGDGEEGDEDSDDLPRMVKPTTMSEDMDAEDAGEDADEGEEEDEENEQDELPSFEFRFECAKLLLELDDTTTAAVQVLEDMLAENDGVPEAWHLLGLAYYSGGDLGAAAEVTEQGVKLMRSLGVGEEEELALSFADLEAAIAEARKVGEGDGGAGGADGHAV